MYKGERFNSYTHLIGAAGSAVGLIVLLYVSVRNGDLWQIFSFSVYGASLLMLYVCSTLYHSFRGKWKNFFKKMDHIAIYLLIAGTYTPFTLVTLRGEVGWWMFGLVWGLAVVGILMDLFHRSEKRIPQLIIYLLMGWLAIFMFEPLTTSLSPTGFYWLLTGGLFYTGGVIFYVLSDKHRFAHGIWHLFVLAGSVSHFVTVLLFI
ncbi:MAG: hemolysin III family protein [Balneolaceae bacterium]|nr:MAG: hemolysin III family protein [Balneolaceae bacterium]